MCVPVLSGLLYLPAVSLGAVVTQLRVYCRSARRSAHFRNAAVHRVQVAVNDAHPGVVRLVDSGSYVRRWLPLSLQLHAGAASPHSSDERTLHSSLALSTAVVLNPLPRARCALRILYRSIGAPRVLTHSLGGWVVSMPFRLHLQGLRRLTTEETASNSE